MEQESKNQQEPIVADPEATMPAGSFGATENTPDRTTQLGIIIGILIVILVLILGGLYIWGTTLQSTPTPEAPQATRPTAAQNNEPESPTADAQVQALETVSTSNDIDAIQADIDSTNLDSLDAELNAINTELDAALQAI